MVRIRYAKRQNTGIPGMYTSFFLVQWSPSNRFWSTFTGHHSNQDQICLVKNTEIYSFLYAQPVLITMVPSNRLWLAFTGDHSNQDQTRLGKILGYVAFCVYNGS